MGVDLNIGGIHWKSLGSVNWITDKDTIIFLKKEWKS